MGIDVGQARVGVSLSDPDSILATPLRTLRRDSIKNSDIRVLGKLVQLHGVVEIFVGLPKTMRGGDSASTAMARTYATDVKVELLARGSEVPVWLVDERLTTVTARRSLHDAGVSSRDFKKMVDQVAAVNILQYALDSLTGGRETVGIPVYPGHELTDSAVAAESTKKETESPE